MPACLDETDSRRGIRTRSLEKRVLSRRPQFLSYCLAERQVEQVELWPIVAFLCRFFDNLHDTLRRSGKEVEMHQECQQWECHG